MKQTIKSILAFAALFLCGGAWATQVPYVAFDNSLPTITGSNASSYAIKQSIEANTDGSVTIGEDKGLTLGHAGNSCNTATFIIKGKGLKREIASGKGVHIITLAQNTTSQAGGSHNKIGLALNSEGKLQGVWCNGLRDIAPSTQVALTSGDLLAITIGKNAGQGVVAWEYVNNRWTKVFEDATFLDGNCNYKGFTVGGPYLGVDDSQSFYVPSTDITPATGWTISNVAMFNSILTEAQIAEYALGLQDGIYHFAPILTGSYVSTGWKVSSIDELLTWNFSAEMTGSSITSKPVTAKGCFPVKHTDGTVKVEFQTSNGETKAVSAIFSVENGVVKVKGNAACYFNAGNRVGESMFNADGSRRTDITANGTFVTSATASGYGIQNIVATPNYYMNNGSASKAKGNYDNRTYTLNLPAADGYPVGTKVALKSIAIATEGSGKDLSAKLEINGVKSLSRTSPIADAALTDGDASSYLITYYFEDPVVLTVGTAATSFKFLKANDTDDTASQHRFALASRSTTAPASTGMKFSVLSISGENSWTPITKVIAEPIMIDPNNDATFTGTLSHTAWVVLGKVAAGETINDVALKYGIAAQLGGGSINGGTPLDATDCYAQVHTDGILTVEMHVQDGSNKKNVLVGFKVECGVLKAKWLKGSYKNTTANDRQMTYAENGTISVNSGFTEWNEYEVTKIVVTKADLLNTSVDKPSVLTNNANLKLHLDASSLSNFTISNGEVTQWNDLASSNNATPGTAKKGYIEVVNGVPAFQMGNTGSGIDLQFTRQTDIRTVFWVMDIKTAMEAFFLGDAGANKECHFHRGSNGEYAGSWAGNGWIQAAIMCDGVAAQTSALAPTGLHVFSAVTTENRTASCLSQDRNQSGRNGGRAISELIVFNTALTDAQVKEVNEYLLSKWKGLTFTPLETELAEGETDFSAIHWNDDQVYARGSVATISVGTTAILNIDSDVFLSKLKLTGSGSLTIANAQRLSYETVDVSEFTGSIIYTVDATSSNFIADAGLRRFMKSAGDSVKFKFNGSGNTGATIDYGSTQDTTTDVIFSCHIIFNGGTHTLKYVHEKGGSKFGANATAENPTFLVTNNATLTFTGKNWCGWESGEVNANGIIRVNSGSTLNANTDSVGTFYWAQQFYLEPGSTANFRSNNDNVRFNGGINESAPQIYVPTCAANKANKVATVNLTNNANLEIRDQGSDDASKGAAFFVGENATLKIGGNLTGSKNFTKYGDGILQITGDVTNTGTKTIAAGLYDMGATRNFTSVGWTTSGTGGFLIHETPEEYAKANISVTNPNDVPIKVIRPNDSTIYDYATVEADTVVKIDGVATIFDITFKNNKADIGKAGGGGGHFDYKANAGANLKWDNAAVFTKTAQEEWDDTVGCYLRTHPYIDSAASTFGALTDFSVVVVGQMSPTDNTQFISIGSSDGTKTSILIATTGVENQVMITTASGGTVNTAKAVYAKIPNAATARHAYVITRVGNTMMVYADGTKRGQITLPDNFALGTTGHSGIQVGSDFGGAIKGAGTYKAVVNSEDETGYVNVIRVYDYVLSDAQQQAVFRAYPYISENGLYTRTLAVGENNLDATASWTNSKTQETADLPADNASATLTLTADSSLTLNANQVVETLTVGGTGTLTVKAGTGTVSVSDAAVINTPVVVPYGAIELAGTPITLGANGTLKFDCSSIDVSTDYVVKNYQLTGLMDQEDAKVTATLPTVDAGHTVELTYVDGAYAIKVTPDHANGDRVYLKTSETLGNDNLNGKVYLDAEGANATVKFPNDIVVLAVNGITLTTESGALAAGKVVSGVSGKSVKKEAGENNTTIYSLIDTSTEPIEPSEDPEAEPVVIEDVGAGIAVQPNAKVEIALPEGATAAQKAEISAKITVKYGETVLNPASGTKYVSVTIGDNGAVNVDTTTAAKPAVTEMTETSESAVSISFTPVAGLFYTLESGDTPDSFTPGDAEQATSSDTKTLQLSVPTGAAKVKFYRVRVKATK